MEPSINLKKSKKNWNRRQTSKNHKKNWNRRQTSKNQKKIRTVVKLQKIKKSLELSRKKNLDPEKTSSFGIHEDANQGS